MRILKILVAYAIFVICGIAAGAAALFIYTEYGLLALIGAALALSAIAGLVVGVAERLQDRFDLRRSKYDSSEFFVEPTIDSDSPPLQFPESRALKEASRLPRSRASR
mgnify:CR=1 FL=1